ncbi:hypothetical protein AMATHDRAFT_164609, partial [Amanita thiersii Skay4041]
MAKILPSDIADIGLSNREYSNVAVRLVKHLEDGIEEDIRQLDEKIASCQVTIVNLRAKRNKLWGQRNKLEEQLKGCKAVHAPHKRLPVDVLRHIFLLCINKQGELSLPYCWIPTQIALSRVCSLWRSVALNTPFLW